MDELHLLRSEGGKAIAKVLNHRARVVAEIDRVRKPPHGTEWRTDKGQSREQAKANCSSTHASILSCVARTSANRPGGGGGVIS